MGHHGISSNEATDQLDLPFTGPEPFGAFCLYRVAMVMVSKGNTEI